MRFLGLSRVEEGALVPSQPAGNGINTFGSQTPSVRQARRDRDLARSLDELFTASRRAIQSGVELAVVRETAGPETLLRIKETRLAQEHRTFELIRQEMALEEAAETLLRESHINKLAHQFGVSKEKLRRFLDEERTHLDSTDQYQFPDHTGYEEVPGHSRR